MKERNGVRIGQRLRDLDGTPLGRVTALFDWGFAARKGMPLLFGSDYVVRYDEVRGVRDGELVIARSRRDLFDLAAGGIPPSWRIPAPPSFPTAATPPEAFLVRDAIARGGIPGAASEPPPAERAPHVSPQREDEEREARRPAEPAPGADLAPR